MSDNKLCPVCNTTCNSVEKRRQNTRYVNEDQNYIVSCVECYKNREEYWKEMWEEVYK